MKKRYIWVLGTAGLMFLLCLLMLWRIEERVLVSVDGMEIPQGDAITVGRGSMVELDHVPKDFLSVRRTDSGFVWEVNPIWLKSDSLYYFKVNNSNPNLHPLTNGSTVTIEVAGKTKTSQQKNMSAEQIKKVLKGQDSHYVMLRNVLELDKYLRADSADATDYKSCYNLRSFLFREGTDDNWQLVILDHYTTLQGADHTVVGYAVSDTISVADAQCCKIQFFRMAEFNLKPDKPNKSLFHVGDVNYLAKPVLVPAEWGAGHFNIVAAGDKNEVRFSKPITYVCTTKMLRDMSPTDSHLITIHQNDGSFPSPSSVYIPQFSSVVSNDVCNIRMVADEIFVSDKPIPSNSGLKPTINHFRQPGTHSNVLMHTVKISMGYILSYLWLPLLVLILVVVGFIYVMRPGYKEVRESCEARRNVSAIFPIIAVITFIYCVCKVMISMKLSFTYPYFERLSSIVVTDACLMLVLVYFLSLIINHHLLTASVYQKSGMRRWSAVGIGVVAFILGLYAFKAIDPYVTKSYLPGELGSWRFWQWSNLSGVTDTYRSVPLALLLCNVTALGVLLVLNVDPMKNVMKTRWERFNTWLKNKLPSYVYTLLPLVAVVMASLIPGNFSTAFITLFVIIGMSWSLLRVSFRKGRMIAFLQMLGITVLYLAAAIALGDKGYITNYLGFVAAVVLLYFMLAKGKASHHEGSYMLLIAVGTLLFVIFVFPRLLPLKYNVDEVSYDRTARRFELYSQFDNYLNSGYRYAVADAEFMTVLTHYMYNTSGADPLSPEKHILHPSIASGQAPVIVNDVAVPSSFFGAYGLLAYIVFFGLIVLLCIVVFRQNMQMPQVSGPVRSSPQLVWRTLAVMMWAGTSLYLYLSYIGGVPFTGRLCPGLGVDAVGEAIESCLLLAFMTATSMQKMDNVQQMR